MWISSIELGVITQENRTICDTEKGGKKTRWGRRYSYHQNETQGTIYFPSIVFKVSSRAGINTDTMWTVIPDLPLREKRGKMSKMTIYLWETLYCSVCLVVSVILDKQMYHLTNRPKIWILSSFIYLCGTSSLYFLKCKWLYFPWKLQRKKRCNICIQMLEFSLRFNWDKTFDLCFFFMRSIEAILKSCEVTSVLMYPRVHFSFFRNINSTFIKTVFVETN